MYLPFRSEVSSHISTTGTIITVHGLDELAPVQLDIGTKNLKALLLAAEYLHNHSINSVKSCQEAAKELAERRIWGPNLMEEIWRLLLAERHGCAKIADSFPELLNRVHTDGTTLIGNTIRGAK